MLTTTDVVALIAGMLRAGDPAPSLYKSDAFYCHWAHDLYDIAEQEVTRRRRARQDDMDRQQRGDSSA